MQLLLQSKANVDMFCSKLETPLYMACGEGHAGIARQLLNAGAHIDWICGDEYLTELQNACQNGRVGCVRLLLQHGASVGSRRYDGRYSPLEIARSKSFHVIV